MFEIPEKIISYKLMIHFSMKQYLNKQCFLQAFKSQLRKGNNSNFQITDENVAK